MCTHALFIKGRTRYEIELLTATKKVVTALSFTSFSTVLALFLVHSIAIISKINIYFGPVFAV